MFCGYFQILCGYPSRVRRGVSLCLFPSPFLWALPKEHYVHRPPSVRCQLFACVQMHCVYIFRTVVFSRSHWDIFILSSLLRRLELICNNLIRRICSCAAFGMFGDLNGCFFFSLFFGALFSNSVFELKLRLENVRKRIVLFSSQVCFAIVHSTTPFPTLSFF